MKTRAIKPKKIIGSIALILSVLIAGMILGGILQRNWPQGKPNISNVGKDEPGCGIGAVVSAGESKGMKLSSRKLASSEYTSNGVTSQAESVYTLTATLDPQEASGGAVDWSVSFVNASAAWSIGKTAQEYVTITPTSDGSLTAIAACKDAFGEQIEITVTARDNTDATASCIVDYVKRITKATLEVGKVSPDTAHQGHSLRIGSSIDLTTTFEMGVGTIMGMIGVTGNLGETYVTLSEEFKSAMKTSESFITDEFFQTPVALFLSGSPSPVAGENGTQVAAQSTTGSLSIVSFIAMNKGMFLSQTEKNKFNNAFKTAVETVTRPHAVMSLGYSYTYQFDTIVSSAAECEVYFRTEDIAQAITSVKLNESSIWF